MRILITSFTFPPQTNGVAAVAAAHAFGLAQRGHEVTVATSSDSARLQLKGANLPHIAEFSLAGRARDNVSSGEIKRYQEFIRSFPADIILCHSYRMWHTEFALSVMKENPAKKVLASHGFPTRRWLPSRRFPWGLGGWVRVRLATWEWLRMIRSFDHVVFLSPKVDRDRFFDHWLTRKAGCTECSVIPNGTDPEEFVNSTVDFREHYGIRNDFMVLYVANYSNGKNQESALRAFLRAGIENSRLVFIGDKFNEYSRYLRGLQTRLTQPCSKARVLFLEQLERSMIRAAYNAADLFVMSSKAEVQPLVILDAMASGTPFVATDVGCVGELPGGLVVRSQAQMAARIKELFAAPNRRAELSSVALQAAQSTYHWPSVISAYEQLFKSLLRETTMPPKVCGRQSQ